MNNNIPLLALLITLTVSPLMGAITPTQNWTSRLEDPILSLVLEEGLANNLDIQIATERITAAESLRNSDSATFMPDISGIVSSTRGNTTYGRTGTLSKAGLEANWTPDIFGQTQTKVDAKEAQVLVAKANLEQIKLTTVASITDTLITWRQLQTQIKQTQTLITAQDTLISLLKSRAAAGLIDAETLSQALANRNEIARQLPQAEAMAKTTAYHLSALLNRRDDSLLTDLAASTPIRPKLPAKAIVLNQSIADLQTRPDIRMAEATLGFAKATNRQSKAALWPTVSLSSFFGLQDATDGLPVADNPGWSIGGSISVPIFNFGRLDNSIDATQSAEKEALLTYDKTITQAIRETKTALSEYLHTVDAVTTQEMAITYYKDTLRLAKDRFSHGLTDLTPVLTAESELAQATLSLSGLERDALSAYIRLETALGHSAF
jgi:NodT family efflux transporter outer membrane factor (OMF) lipoprotein